MPGGRLARFALSWSGHNRGSVARALLLSTQHFLLSTAKYSGCRRNFNGMLAEHLRQGRLGERIAGRFLIKQGFDILARRFRGRAGEVDLVGIDGEILVFVEVKTRASREFGDPWEFVDWQKQQSLRRVAEEFIARYDLGQYAYRFDIVSVVAPGTSEEKVILLRNAF